MTTDEVEEAPARARRLGDEAPAESVAPTQAQTSSDAAPALRPSGIGMGVGFDWALMWQFLIMAPFFALGVGPGAQLAHVSLGVRLGTAVALLFPAAATFALGEALRRGWRFAWAIQIALNTLLFVSGFFSISSAFALLHRGLFSGLARLFVLLVIDPITVYLLTRKETRVWLGATTHASANARHSGIWLFWVLAFAALGGAAIAFSGLY